MVHSVVLLVLLQAVDGLAQDRAPYTFIAIGDAGQPGPELVENAGAIRKIVGQFERDRQPVNNLIFLGDNFYPIGLNIPEPERSILIEQVIGPHREVMKKIGRRDVRAIAGNHDYFCRVINGIPLNTCGAGNIREQEIELWNYHYHYPNNERRAIEKGSRDSVEMIYFDSAYLLTRRPDEWRSVLDSLERLLRASATAPGVKWRLFIAHHSPYAIGDHAGWRRWLPSVNRVGYLGNCIGERQDPFRYAQEFVSNQDNCARLYREYSDSLMSIIQRTGARVQAIIAGHDHSLQLMYYPERTCEVCPKVFVISGAGSKRSTVKSPHPPYEFSHPLNTPEERGKSVAGFVVGQFAGKKLTLRFIEAGSAEVVDMGGGTTTFEIDESGRLLNAR